MRFFHVQRKNIMATQTPPTHNMNDLLNPIVLNEVKYRLQNIDNDTIKSLTVSELKRHIRDAIRILLIEHDNFGYSSEEIEFYMLLKFKTLATVKTKSYIKTQVSEAIKETSYITTTKARVFGKEQKRFAVREWML
jgi:hypothetical protein